MMNLPPVQVSNDVNQLRLLSKLLSSTWKEGAAWGHQPLAAGSLLPCGIPCPWSTSALHQCWLSLSLAFLEQGQVLEVIRLVDLTQHAVKEGMTAPLADTDVESLINKSAPGIVLATTLSLLSPNHEHQSAAIKTFEVGYDFLTEGMFTTSTIMPSTGYCFTSSGF